MSLIKDVLIHLAGVNQNVQRVPNPQAAIHSFNEQSLLSAALLFHAAADQHICLRALKWNCWWHKKDCGRAEAGGMSAEGSVPVSHRDKCHCLDNNAPLSASQTPVKVGVPDDTVAG